MWRIGREGRGGQQGGGRLRRVRWVDGWALEAVQEDVVVHKDVVAVQEDVVVVHKGVW